MALTLTPVYVGAIVQYAYAEKNQDGSKKHPEVNDKHCPLLVCNVHPQPTGLPVVDGWVFNDTEANFVEDIHPGTPSEFGKYHVVDD